MASEVLAQALRDVVLEAVDRVVREVVREEVLPVMRDEVRAVLADARAAASTERVYLTVAEAADLVRVTPATIREWIDAGALRGYRAGRLLRVRRDDLESYLASTPQEGTETSAIDARVLRIVKEL